MSDLTPFIDELRSRLLVSDILRPYVTLHRKGREYQGLCPFHMEKTPSFTVNDQKGFYHCFGCGAHGDVVRFYTDYLKLPFMEALEKLATQAGVSVPKQKQLPPGFKNANDVLACLKKAQEYYQQALFSPKGHKALTYMLSRGLLEKDAKTYGLGYAPESGLYEYLKAEGFAFSVIEKAGLCLKVDEKPIMDRFKNRLMFPIFSQKGTVIAFGARTLDGRDPKYLNSPETEVFHKGKNLYGLNWLDLKEQVVLVVEGYMDVVSVHKNYGPIALAPLGTALTEDQLSLLWKRTPSPIMCFDGDAAGKRASKRALERALPHINHTKTLKFMVMPPSHDPDSFLREKGKDAFKTLLETATPLSEKLWEILIENNALSTPEEKSHFLKELEAYCLQIKDQNTSKFYLNDIKNKFYTYLRESKNSSKPRRSGILIPPVIQKQDVLEKKILVILLRHPKLVESNFDELMKLMFKEPDLDRLRQVILDRCCHYPDQSADCLKEDLYQNGFEEIVQNLIKDDIIPVPDFNQDSQKLTRLFEAFHEIESQKEMSTLTQEAKRLQDEDAWKRLKAFKLLQTTQD